MRPFIHDDFLLSSEPAKRLYHDYAATEPIYDYHTHLPTRPIVEDERFDNIYDLWLKGDHYKWRAMRANGIDERLITGDAEPKDKFLAWAATVPHTLRNPLYHWTHLELKRYFDIDELLSPDTAEAIWEQTRERIHRSDFSVRQLLSSKKVKLVCTTDDPADSLADHQSLAREPNLATKVYPTFRPDQALKVDQPAAFNQWIASLEKTAGQSVATFSDLVSVLRQRHNFFHECGCRLSDHGLDACYFAPCADEQAAAIFERARQGQAATPAECDGYRAWLMLYFGQLDAEKGWTKQLHLGPMRNNHTKLYKQLGPDIGCDSIGDYPQAMALSRYLDTLLQRGHLPKTVIYNLNPRDNHAIAACIGNFQGRQPGYLQFGSGWWFLDNEVGMKWQIDALSQQGLLSHFVGMLTDSRSFLSSTRHEYFRRILCEMLGKDMARGAVPMDYGLVGEMVQRICYQNAVNYFGMKLD